jgi:sulfur-carrier protein adenylyltransferase/sulfurtransferase
VKEISVQDLKSKHDAKEDFVLLDVREPDEIQTASIPWAITIPMGDVPQRVAELPKDKTIAVMCHGGGRSARVTSFLNENGYPDAVNVDGGIRAWSAEIDPTVPDY